MRRGRGAGRVIGVDEQRDEQERESLLSCGGCRSGSESEILVGSCEIEFGCEEIVIWFCELPPSTDPERGLAPCP